MYNICDMEISWNLAHGEIVFAINGKKLLLSLSGGHGHIAIETPISEIVN